MRKASIAVAVLGVLLLVAAVVTKWAVAPSMVKLPSDTDVTRTYAGTASTLLNPGAIASGSTTNALLQNVPVVATHRTEVLDSNSDSSLVSDVHTLSVSGNPVGSATYRYAVDRTDLGRGSGFSN